jgi:hypothetical protein
MNALTGSLLLFGFFISLAERIDTIYYNWSSRFVVSICRYYE